SQVFLIVIFSRVFGVPYLIIMIVYSFFKEPFDIRLEYKTIFLKKLPTNFEGLKIIQISDLHSKKFGKKEKRILEIISQQKADFLFITGDINEARASKINSNSKFWEELGKTNFGCVYAVFGNHLYEDKKIEPIVLKSILEKSGIKVLDNENVKLKREGQYIWLLGINDPHTNHHNLPKALQGVDNFSIRILLSHTPEIIDDLKTGDADLILAGHTHGGQVKIPGIRASWIPTKYHGKYARGLFKVKGAYMYVNRGIGNKKLPMRFNSRPEITLIKLTRRVS
ncbi:metallophosphoesterase, partial [bacterium]|nr:metallophosphoesterase [bacterium]